ncbi:glycoside hydrolase family 71/99-like protein [Marinoscillum sp. 108]|uniref:Glycoside hydrolase family 71/99-like protein n=1 Tax=Marinoscillum luteum TaxID=861051 RepID=A0ABW7NBB6_9BACT|nr:glycoside hydrolase family 71/99-like protein [Marinoscillum sp. 108]
MSTSVMWLCVMLCAGLFGCDTSGGEEEIKADVYEPVKVSKTNATKLYMHYMPWFEGKEYSGYWGSHWRMANKNPDNMDSEGKREIAAHYYPLIGPYDSGDPDVIAYHLLLMKYAGIDGVLIDWYGSHKVLDYAANLDNSNALIAALDTIGLNFGIVYEEYTAEKVETRKGITAIEAAQTDLLYMEENYFSNDRYITIEEEPLVLTFGPRFFRKADEWTEIFSVMEKKLKFLPLWNHGNLVGAANTAGEFSWIDFNYTLSELDKFYAKTNQGVTVGSIYPGFHDYYKEGGWGESYGYVRHLDGMTMRSTFDLAKDSNLQFLQLITWNDFGEGTMIEPTQEYEFLFLELIQEFSGVPYTKAELELVHTYYLKKKAHKGDPDAALKLREIFTLLNELEPAKAEQILKNL